MAGPLDLTNLAADIKSRNDEASYLNNLLSELFATLNPGFISPKSSVTETALKRHGSLRRVSHLDPAEIYAEQIKILDLALERLEDSFGGTASAVRPLMTMARSWPVNSS